MSTLPPDRPRVLIVSNTCLARERRRELRALQEFCDLTCAFPERVTALGQPLDPCADDDTICLIPLPNFGNSTTASSYVLPGLGDVLKRRPFDMVITEFEPSSWLRWQAWFLTRLHQPQALFGDFAVNGFEQAGIRGFLIQKLYHLALRTSEFSISGSDDATARLRQYGRAEAAVLCCSQVCIDPPTDSPYFSADEDCARASLSSGPARLQTGRAEQLSECEGGLDTHESVVCRSAEYLRQQVNRLKRSRVLTLADTSRSQRRVGPRRFAEELPDGATYALLSRSFIFPSDEAMLGRFAWLKTTAHWRIFFRIVGLFNVLRHAYAIRRAEVIFCQAPHYFWWLIALNRYGLNRLGRQRVVVLYFLSDSFFARLAWWKEAPPGFQAYFTSREQILDLEARGCPPGRLRYLAWKVDTQWFVPSASPEGGYLLVAGNIHRDEQLIQKLAERLPLPIVRVGQIGRLQDLYRNTRVRLVFNASHADYLRLLQNATALLLPIEPCDEPAGLTATLEALACEVPVIANSSMEVGALLRQSTGALPLPDLQVDTWVAAVEALASGNASSPEARRRGREYVVAEHSLSDKESEWRPLLGSFAAVSPPW